MDAGEALQLPINQSKKTQRQKPKHRWILVILLVLISAIYLPPLVRSIALASSLKNTKILVGFQNSAELRPTGGFWGSFGIWTIEDNIFDSTFYFETNPYKKDNPLLKESTQSLPKPLQETYPDRPQSFVNANWPINFPDTAKDLIWFLSSGWSEEVDGVIAISSLAMIDLLKTTGPIELPDGSLIDNDNFTRVMSEKIDTEYWQDEKNIAINEPKTILKDLAPTVIQRLRKMKPWEITKFTLAQMRKGRILFYSTKKSQQQLARSLKISGELMPYSRDFLTINDANLNGGKSSLNIKQKIDYEVEIKSGKVVSTLNINKSLDDSWPGIMNRNYTRVLVPLGAKLLLATRSGEDITGQIAIEQENARTSYGFWSSTAPNENTSVQIKYELPFDKSLIYDYNLVYQKQPGTKPQSLRVKVDEKVIYDGNFNHSSKRLSI